MNNKIELTNGDIEVTLASMIINKYHDYPDLAMIQLHSLFTSIVGKRMKDDEHGNQPYYRALEKVGRCHSQLNSAIKSQDPTDGYNTSGIDLAMCWGGAIDLKDATQKFCQVVGIDEIVITSNKVGLRPVTNRLNDFGFNIRVERIENETTN